MTSVIIYCYLSQIFQYFKSTFITLTTHSWCWKMQLNANKPFIIISRNKAYTHAIKAAAEEISARVLKPADLIHDDKKQFPKQKQ